MRIKKSKLLFFFYAIIMLWPEYFSNSLTGLMANALALVGLLFVFKNSKRISRFSILAAVYFVYFVVDTYFHGGGDIHTLISNMKIVISIMFVDVYLTKEDQYDTISTIFWIVFFFAMLNFATLLLFPMVCIKYQPYGMSGEQPRMRYIGFLAPKIVMLFGICCWKFWLD